VMGPLDGGGRRAFAARVILTADRVRQRALWTVLLLAFCLPFAARGQTEEEPPPAATAEPKPAPAPASVPIDEVGTRAELAKQAISNQILEAAPLGDLKEPTEAGYALIREVAEREAGLSDALDNVVSLDRLMRIDQQWLERDARINDVQAGLKARLDSLDALLSKLGNAEKLWTETLEQARAADSPESVQTLAAEVRERSQRAAASLQEMRSKIVDLRTRIGAQTARVARARTRIAQTRNLLLANIFVRDDIPLWLVGSSQESMLTVAQRVSNEFVSQLEATQKLALEQKERGSFQLLLVALVIIIGRSARKRSLRWPQEDPRTEKVAVLLRHPIAIAFLAGLLATKGIYEQPPRAVQELADLLVLFPALVLIAPLLDRSLRPAVLWLAGFYVLDQIRDVADPLPVVSRFLFTLEMLLAVGSGSWFCWRFRQIHPGNNGVATASADFVPEPETLILRWVPSLLQAATVACGVAAACSILGFQRLGRLIGDSLLESAYLAILLYALVHSAQACIVLALRNRFIQPIRTVTRYASSIEGTLARLLGLGAILGWIAVVLHLFGVRDDLLSILAVVFATDLGVGLITISLGDIAVFGLTITLAIGLARLIEIVLDADIYPRLHTPRGSAYAFSTILRYLIILVGFMTAITAMGFDTNRLTVLIGAFGVGLGFGLQTVVNNFVSGLILLFERPIQVGDAIEVETIAGTVRHIGIRASVVRTFDGSEVSVPNGNLLSQQLTNWTMSDRHRRLEIPVGVAYGTDPNRVLQLLLGVASQHPQILSEPAPQALFLGFGDSSLNFALRAWVRDQDVWVGIRSELVLGVHRSLTENGIEIPFPQRDLHLRSVPSSASTSLAQLAPPDSAPATQRE